MIFNTQLDLNDQTLKDLETVYFHVFECTEYPSQANTLELKELILTLASTGLLIDHDRVQPITEIEDCHNPVIKELYSTLYMFVDDDLPKHHGIEFKGTMRDPDIVFSEFEKNAMSQSLGLKQKTAQKHSKML